MEWRCGRLDIDRRLGQQRQRRCDCGLLSRKRHVELRDEPVPHVGVVVVLEVVDELDEDGELLCTGATDRSLRSQLTSPNDSSAFGKSFSLIPWTLRRAFLTSEKISSLLTSPSDSKRFAS